MTVDELKSAIAERREKGCNELMLTVPGNARGHRKRVAPGVLGVVANVHQDEHGNVRTLVWCKLDDLERAIARGRIR